jgi:hypothetical protein
LLGGKLKEIPNFFFFVIVGGTIRFDHFAEGQYVLLMQESR